LAKDHFEAYQLGDWSKVSSRTDKGLIVHFWGVTCGPCMSEMPAWGKFAKLHPDQVVFIQVDQAPVANVRNLAMKLHVDQFQNYYTSVQFDERMRYEINPSWQGETPFTVMLSRTGRQNVFAGNADFKKMTDWLKSNS
jgi:thiol-disulfide isomerase/thioredoxin